uniref:Uncharacterized protein n=1 Tax=Lotharella vacuolata TaxID=74820 RepID=A0A0H5BK15_9EUKA|nr:hypothetical protein [Lotharella vacuolata]
MDKIFMEKFNIYILKQTFLFYFYLMLLKIPKFDYDKEKLLLFIKHFKIHKKKKYLSKIKRCDYGTFFIFTVNFSDIFKFFSTKFNYDIITITNLLYNTERYLKIILIIIKEILLISELQKFSKHSSNVFFFKNIKKYQNYKKKKIKIYVYPSIFHNSLSIVKIDFKNINSLVKLYGIIKYISKNYIFINSLYEKKFIEDNIKSNSNIDNKIFNLLSDKIIFQKNFTQIKFLIIHQNTFNNKINNSELLVYLTDLYSFNIFNGEFVCISGILNAVLDYENFQILKIYLDSHCFHKKTRYDLHINIKKLIGKMKNLKITNALNYSILTQLNVNSFSWFTLKKILSICILENNTESNKYYNTVNQIIHICTLGDDFLIDDILEFFQNLNLSIVYDTCMHFLFLDLTKPISNLKINHEPAFNVLSKNPLKFTYSDNIKKFVTISLDTHCFYKIKKNNNIIDLYNNAYLINEFIAENTMNFSEYCFILKIKYTYKKQINFKILKFLISKFDLILILKNINLYPFIIINSFTINNNKKILNFTKKKNNFIKKLFSLMRMINIAIPQKTKNYLKLLYILLRNNINKMYNYNFSLFKFTALIRLASSFSKTAFSLTVKNILIVKKYTY